MLIVGLDSETERYLAEILVQEKTTSEELLKQLIRDRWLSLQPRQTIAERLGGHPEYLLEDAPPDLSSREVRKKKIAEYLEHRHEKRQSQ